MTEPEFPFRYMVFNISGWWLIRVSGWCPFPFWKAIEIERGFKINLAPYVTLEAVLLRRSDQPERSSVDEGGQSGASETAPPRDGRMYHSVRLGPSV